MDRYKKDLGDFGEKIALNYLIEKNYRIVCTNYYIKGGEIDIIAEIENFCIFIEVKTRTSDKYGSPSESVTKNKINHLIKTAEKYLIDYPTDKEIRFDVIEVYANCLHGVFEFSELNHIKGIIID